MQQTRWTNPYNPQTLQIANILLYINAFWLILALFGGGNPIYLLIVLAAMALHIFGGWGIANRKKRGYQAAVAAAFLPMALRLIFGILDSDTSLVSAILEAPGLQLLRGPGLIGYMFEIALIGLILYPEGREYQRLWFD